MAEILRPSARRVQGLLLPGATGGVRGYCALMSALETEGVAVAGLNPRGCGASTGTLHNLTLENLADDVLRVAAALGHKRPVLIGHAGGNRVARVAAAMWPDRVRALVLLAAGGRAQMEPAARAAMVQLFRRDYESEAERDVLTRGAFFAQDNEIPQGWFNVPDRSPLYATAFQAALDNTPDPDWWLGGTAPMLVIQGAQDKIAPPANGAELKARAPDRVWLETLPDAAHALHVEKPARIARKVAAFLARLG